ncbi:hypothetical protein A5707_16675 [Mycobacterium kyorinense]|uniref:Uncharacterized protein n=1 Tax=Mycobacterium kyorinense TaxID=487514 RepID=A0A1A2ZJF2_9MYCO|nr:hypothetical protein [Mycobacterium kyorinense]OBI49602.1 hypothetical protein A5707_16675 [Mycobacterium kyorinense]
MAGAGTSSSAAAEEPAAAAERPVAARGAALASANAPLFASSTAALAYAQDPGTGEVNRDVIAPAYLDVSANASVGPDALAYSAVADEDDDSSPRRRPFLLVGSGAAAIVAIGVVAVVVSLASDVRPSVGQRPNPDGKGVVPTAPATGGPAG